jgi:hypothetical protein
MIEVSTEFLADVLETSPGELTQALKDGEQFKPQADIEAFIKDNLVKNFWRQSYPVKRRANRGEKRKP